MRDQNRVRERFELSLDGRQVASVIVGALVILAGVFVLGLNVGRQIGGRQGPAPQAGADPLAALDSPATKPDAGEPPPRLSYHETLTRPQAPEPRPAAPKPSPASSPIPTPTPATATIPAMNPAQAPPPTHAAPPVAPSPPAPAPKPRPLPAAEPAFAVQVGASQDRAEAGRIAEKFKAQRARVVAADIPGKGRWYRVRVGAFEDKASAEAYLRDLARETGAKGFVTPGN
jgi:cell division septation protein DedD